MPPEVRKRKTAAEKAKTNAKVPKPAAAAADDEDIPNTRPFFMWATPVVCLALLAYLALTTTRRIGPGSYASLWGAPAPVAPDVLRAAPVEVRELPGRGKGLVAVRAIARGELLTREPPLLHGIPLESACPAPRLVIHYPAHGPAQRPPTPRR
jgi:hypothetical protein